MRLVGTTTYYSGQAVSGGRRQPGSRRGTTGTSTWAIVYCYVESDPFGCRLEQALNLPAKATCVGYGDGSGGMLGVGFVRAGNAIAAHG